MAELKTKPTSQSAEEFLKQVEPEQKRQDCFEILELMKKITGSQPVMWGSSIVGFGQYRYKYASGREGDWLLTGFSPRKQNLTIYIMSGFDSRQDLMKKLGKYTTSVSCLYVKKLSDIDKHVLAELIEYSVKQMQTLNP